MKNKKLVFFALVFSFVFLLTGSAADVQVIDSGVAFVEIGLPVGAQWGVTCNGTFYQSTTSVISISLPPSTYNYSVPAISGYDASPASGNVSAILDPIKLTSITFSPSETVFSGIAFAETGLPPGTLWEVICNGTLYESTTPYITVTLPVGTYPYSILENPGFEVSLEFGYITLTPDLFRSTTVIFKLATPISSGVAFHEVGLPAGTVWSVTCNGTLHSSITPDISISLPPGDCDFSVTPISDYDSSPQSGKVTAALDPIILTTITFSASIPEFSVGSVWFVSLILILIFVTLLVMKTEKQLRN